MILEWIMDYDKDELYIYIGENLYYRAFAGGTKPYLKRFRKDTTSEWVESWISPWFDSDGWFQEKHWISKNYSDLVGKYEPVDVGPNDPPTRIHPLTGIPEWHTNGSAPDGTRLDHMQRTGYVMLGWDCAPIANIDNILFETPDQGKTIFKRNSLARSEMIIGDDIKGERWTENAQACHVQPNLIGRQLSSYTEMVAFGVNELDVAKCQRGVWDLPTYPELQKQFVYPTK